MTNCQKTMPEDKSADKDVFDSDFEIFLLIGQSNMAGRADIEIEDRDSLVNVLLFSGTKGKEWEKAANPLNKYSTVRKDLSFQKLGPGYTFGRKMAEVQNQKKIGLVVNAKGGTSISEWMPGQTLYNESVKRARMAMNFGVLKGIVWHQGESDVSKASEYLDMVSAMIQSLRNDLGYPNLPFVAGQLSEDNPARKDFNEMIMTLPSIVPKTAVVTSDGTNTIDGTHFDSASQRILGYRYAAEMLKLMQ